MDKIQNMVKKLKKLKSVKAAILFGSQAKGKSRKNSDIDIGNEIFSGSYSGDKEVYKMIL